MAIKDKEKKKAYHRKYMNIRYHSDPEFKKKILARNRKNDSKYTKERKAAIQRFRSNGCSICSENEPCCLSAHHIDPSLKDFNIGESQSKKFSAKKVELELAKCICLCNNCHAKVHAGILSLSIDNIKSTKNELNIQPSGYQPDALTV